MNKQKQNKKSKTDADKELEKLDKQYLIKIIKIYEEHIIQLEESKKSKPKK